MEHEGTQRLRLEIERTLRRAFDPADVLPRLARLARMAPAASDDAVFAHRQLAELLAERHPWRAALHARHALGHRDDDDRAWAVLAFCQTLLGNFRCAVTAYKKALACSPGNPWYAHNLGHLLDVAIGQPVRAVAFLRAAHAGKPDSSEMAASFAHALARSGRTEEARRVLSAGLARHPSRELSALMRWLDQGAPALRTTGLRSSRPPGPRRRSPRLVRVLSQGLESLPLDSRQRTRALALARDAAAAFQPPPRASAEELACLAAAVAYAIVYVDHVPLSQAEVAAPFRVAVARLRGRFAELRAKLDLMPGDTRYATTRR